MKKIAIKSEQCKTCGACVVVCPESILEQTNKGDVPSIVHPELCFHCGQCGAVCANDAIEHESFPSEAFEPLSSDKSSSEQFRSLYKGRRSVRSMQTKQVPREEIELIIESASYAPTGHNVQSTLYTVIQDPELLTQLVDETVTFFAQTAKQVRNPLISAMMKLFVPADLKEAKSILGSFERIVESWKTEKDTILFNAPTVILFHADKTKTLAQINAQLGIQNAMLMAHSLDLGSFYTGYLVEAAHRSKKIRSLLNIPAGQTLFAGLAIGYPKVPYTKSIVRKSPVVQWK